MSKTCAQLIGEKTKVTNNIAIMQTYLAELDTKIKDATDWLNKAGVSVDAKADNKIAELEAEAEKLGTDLEADLAEMKEAVEDAVRRLQ